MTTGDAERSRCDKNPRHATARQLALDRVLPDERGLHLILQ
jgi:hypothetical protein